MISGTQTQTGRKGGSTQTTQHQNNQKKEKVAILKLKAPKENEKEEKKPPARRVNWQEDVVDNEHMNRMKSNSKPIYNVLTPLVCCIYHPSDERIEKAEISTSPSTCSSDSDNEIERSRETKKNHLKTCSKNENGEVSTKRRIRKNQKRQAKRECCD